MVGEWRLAKLGGRVAKQQGERGGDRRCPDAPSRTLCCVGFRSSCSFATPPPSSFAPRL